jgi:hypothetical protein
MLLLPPAMKRYVNIAEVKMSALQTAKRDGGVVDTTILTMNGGIGIEAATRMRFVTTQRG